MKEHEALELLRKALGDPAAHFREGQWDAIDRIVNRAQKLLVVQRTGWGKSSVYFISTRALRDRGKGPTLIVSPLLALMRNQIAAAAGLGIRAATINSANREDWQQLTDNLLNDRYDAVLISPERLANESFVETVLAPLANRIGLFVVDEAHCISDWGHDFRPDYRRLVNVLRQMPPNMPVLATTATANNRVLADIEQQVGGIEVIRGSLARESLCLETLVLPDQSARLAWLAQHVPTLPGTGIVYVLTQRDAEQVAGWLSARGIETRAYYSDVWREGFEDSNAYRLHLEDLLSRNQIKVLVATVALGMGYDKPDLGFVIHYQAPGSIVGYYQQVGRAGRGIENAYAVLLSGHEDENIHDYFRRTAFPTEDQVEIILRALAETDGLTTPELEQRVNLRFGQIEKVLKYLSVEEQSPVVKDGARWKRTPVRYRMDHERIERLTQQREVEWQEVQAFIDTRDCLMGFLRQALDDPLAEPCGRCSSCRGEAILPSAFAHSLGIEAAAFLRRSEAPLEAKKRIPRGSLEQYALGTRMPAELLHEQGRVLSRWGDAGWGKLVVDGKHANGFADELVSAAADMIQTRWRPQPTPAWLCCVPSWRHPELVPDFAQRLAAMLGLPFAAVVRKIRDNEPQKMQQNSFYRCRNLDGVFEIDNGVLPGPVLLIDDVVDSGWTLTIVSALLRRSGAGPVFPMVLASTGTSD